MEPLLDLDLGGMPPVPVRKLAFLDTETTGWRPDICDVIDVAVICEGLPWTSRVKISPFDEERGDRYCGKGWREVTGYTREAWATAPSAVDVAPDLARQLHGKILVSYNLGFDVSFNRSFLERQGIPWRSVFSESAVDLYALCKTMLKPLGLKKFNLAAVCEFFGIPPEDKHEALGGAERCRKVYLELCKRVWRP